MAALTLISDANRSRLQAAPLLQRIRLPVNPANASFAPIRSQRRCASRRTCYFFTLQPSVLSAATVKSEGGSNSECWGSP